MNQPRLHDLARRAAGYLRLLTVLGLVVGTQGFAEPPCRGPACPEAVGGSADDQARHLQLLGVDRCHAAGVTGRGVKVAVLDSGFRGYRSFLGSALPPTVRAKSFRRDGDLEARNSQHGILCAEAIHAIAPDAELLLANWEPDDPCSFLDAVRWAREQGAKIISCSLIMPSWSDGEGGGSVNLALADVVGTGEAPGDVLFFACAGNMADRHWCGDFTPDGDGYHQWQGGRTTNALQPWCTDRVAVELYGRGASGYELLVHDRRTRRPVGRPEMCLVGETDQEGSCVMVRFLPEADCCYEVRLRRRTGVPPTSGEKLHLVVLGGHLEHATGVGSIACPADGPGALAVGAVDPDGQRWFYSSCGPNSRRPKPDFVAVVPFPSRWRERPFAGTSAAAPQAAGVAALVWSQHPTRTAGQVRYLLQRTARDLGLPGHDHETGYGLIQPPR